MVVADAFAEQHFHSVAPVRLRPVLSLSSLNLLHVDPLQLQAQVAVYGSHHSDLCRVGPHCESILAKLQR